MLSSLLFFFLSSVSAIANCEVTGINILAKTKELQDLSAKLVPACGPTDRELLSRVPKRSVQDVVKEISSSDSRLVVIGEYHAHQEWDKIPQLAERLKAQSGDFNCFFLEYGSQSVVDVFLKEYRRLREQSQTTEGLPDQALTNICRQGLLEDVMCQNFRFMNMPSALVKIDELGLRIFAVDMPDPSEDDYEVWMESRDDHMAKMAIELLANGSCRRAVFPVGAAHLIPATEARMNATLKHRLAPLAPSYVHLIRPAERKRTFDVGEITVPELLMSTPHPMVEQNGCFSELKTNAPVGFSSNSIEALPLLDYGLWGIFDWTLVIP